MLVWPYSSFDPIATAGLTVVPALNFTTPRPCFHPPPLPRWVIVIE